jgi:hypothetical protein
MHVKCRPSDRVRFDAPAESLRAPVVVHLHRVHRPDRREQRPARAVPARLPDREGGDAGRVQGQTVGLAQEGVHIVYALLGLSVLVSMFGVINTIVLSVFERTREIGMLRGRHDPSAGPLDGPPREHRHCPDRRRARDGGRHLPRRPHLDRALQVRPRVRTPLQVARSVRRRTPPDLPHLQPHGQGAETLNPTFYAAAREPKTLWQIPEASHTGGLTARPKEYERRVIAFFDNALLKGK